MSTSPVPRPGTFRSPSEHGPSVPSQRAVFLAELGVAVVVMSYAILGVALVVVGEEAISDTWVGAFGAVALLGGLGLSFVAFVTAVAARIQHVRQALLWVPLAVFPSLAAIVLLAEWLWLE